MSYNPMTQDEQKHDAIVDLVETMLDGMKKYNATSLLMAYKGSNGITVCGAGTKADLEAMLTQLIVKVIFQ